MTNDVRLFINDQEIEFSADPKILLNYKETELHNPTIVRNSFTKQITVQGTNQNNDIFGHIWELTRIQDENFNPIKKTDFQLFVNDELFQKGYCKLDQVTRTNNTTEYKITLYGGLGQFFYNLTYDQDDSGNQKKTLASLDYGINGNPEPELDFTIDKDNVKDAWGQLINTSQTVSDRWNVINFVPALNGIPNDFDAAKILINNNELNNSGPSGFYNSWPEDGTTYKPSINGALNQNGYSLAEMPEDLQEWQTRDLRSYNQRPCINMQRIIQACCNPINNGGYQVKLDSHFFYSGNPYYSAAWLTMPMLKDLDGVGGGETFNITGASITNPSTQYDAKIYAVNYNQPAASLNNVKMSVSLRFNPESSTSAANLYPHHFYLSPGTTIHGSTYVRKYESNSAVIMQMFALGQNGKVVGQSKAYLLGGSKEFFENGGDVMWDKFWDPSQNGGDIGVQPEYEFIEGYFKKINGSYVFVNKLGQKTNINFSFIAPSDFATIVMKVKTPYGYYIKYGFSGMESYQAPQSTLEKCYTSATYETSGNHTITEAFRQGEVNGHYGFVVESFEGVATDYEGLFSGTKITKERLLTGSHTPADYLLSYCKLFGLYFYYDSTEEADDPTTCPSGVVHIMDRDTFYTDEVMDLSKMIDWNKKVDITPALASSKWYRFDTEHTDSELETGYKEQYGQTYGSQVVNTNYNFDSNTTDLYDGNVFKSAIMCLEKDKYYKKSAAGLPVYQYNGLTYNLFHRDSSNNEFNTCEIEYPVTTTMHMYSINQDYEFYDGFPKLQFHGEDNAPVDGSDVLVFLRGSVDVNADYWLTDDVNEMITLNDANPCWILTKSAYDAAGSEIAKKINKFPYFTRDLIIFGTYGDIVHSWNFGHPQVIYSPDTYTTDGDAIYDVAWRDYIRDLYSVDTRKLTCYVRAEMDERPWPYWLRRFYWFENSIWALNEIKDLNPASFDTCKMEFIKVQDMNNYKLAQIKFTGYNNIEMTDTEIGCEGGVVHGVVRMQGSGSWFAGAWVDGVYGDGQHIHLDSSQVMSPYYGSGPSTNFQITVPANELDTPITWNVWIQDEYYNYYGTSFVQNTCDTGSTLYLTPTATTVYSPNGVANLSITAIRVTDLSATTDVNWCTVSITGSNVEVLWQKNNTTTQRTATITLTGIGVEGPISATAILVQEGLGNITTNTNQIVLDWNAAGTKTVYITTNDDWTSNINDN